MKWNRKAVRSRAVTQGQRKEALSVVVHCGPLSCNGIEGVKEGDLGVVQHCSVEGG